MCLAIPGKLISIETGRQPLMGTVSFSGVKKDVCLDLIPDVTVGEYVIVHVGFAINKMDEHEAEETLKLIGELQGELEEGQISDHQR